MGARRSLVTSGGSSYVISRGVSVGLSSAALAALAAHGSISRLGVVALPSSAADVAAAYLALASAYGGTCVISRGVSVVPRFAASAALAASHGSASAATGGSLRAAARGRSSGRSSVRSRSSGGGGNSGVRARSSREPGHRRVQPAGREELGRCTLGAPRERSALALPERRSRARNARKRVADKSEHGSSKLARPVRART